MSAKRRSPEQELTELERWHEIGLNAPAAKRARRPSVKHTEQRYAKVHDQLEAAERDLQRTFNRWAKLKKQARYYAKLLDLDYNEKAEKAGKGG